MVATVKKSKLMEKYGTKVQAAVKAHGGDETKYSGGGELPGGASGECQIVDCRFAEYGPKTQMAGEMFFIMAGVVTDEFCVIDGVKVRIKGKRVQIKPEPLCGTPTKSRKTTDEHVAWILNEFRKLGIDTSNAGAEDLENFAAVIMEQKPKARFHVWQPPAATEGQYKGKASDPIHFFDGLVEDSGSDGGPTGIEDNTATEESGEAEGDEGDVPFGDNIDDLVAAAQDDSDEEARDAAQFELMNRAQAVGKTQEECEDSDTTWEMLGEWIREGENGDGGESDEVDLDALAEAADAEQESGDEGEACAKLRELAEPLELEPDGYATWADLVEAIKAASENDAVEDEATEENVAQLGSDADDEQSTGEEGPACARLRELAEEQGVDPNEYESWTSLAEVLGGEASGDDDWAPQVDEVYGYQAAGTKKATEHVVTKVNTQAQTVVLKNLDSDRVVLGKDKKPVQVQWSELVRSEE